jgi:hypothetical protein
MNLTTLPTVVTLIIALSVATERLVEIVKGMNQWLDQEKTADPKAEGRRRAALQLLAVIGGIIISALAWPITKQIVPSDQPWLVAIALGLLSSGGSGFWNSILGYVTNLKDLREADVERVKNSGTPGTRPVAQPSEGALRP